MPIEDESEHDMIKTTLKDMFKYLPAQVVPGIVGFISIPIITRLFAPGEYGNYVIVISTTSIFSTIVGWLYLSIIRFYPAYERDKKLGEFYGTILKMTLISIVALTLGCSFLLLFFKSTISEKLYRLLWIGVPVFLLSSCFFTFIEFLRAQRKIGSYSIFKVWRSIAGIALGILLVVVFKLGVDGLLWGITLSLVVTFPFLWKLSVGQSFSFSTNISLPLTTEVARYGFPIVAGNLAAWILSLSDRYVLELFRGSQEVGIYSASYAISEHSMILIATLFAATSGSIVFNLWEKEGEEKSREFISQITRYYLLVGIPAAIGLCVLSKPLIGILTGDQYQEGYRIIPLVVTGAFFLGLQQRFQVGLTFFKKTNVIMYSIIIAGFLNLGLNFLLIPKHGYMAAAATTFVSYIALLMLMVVFSRHYFVWNFPFKTMLKSLCASGIMGMIAYFAGTGLTSEVWINLTAGIIAGIIVYSAMIVLLKEIQPDEKEILRKALSSFLK